LLDDTSSTNGTGDIAIAGNGSAIPTGVTIVSIKSGAGGVGQYIVSCSINLASAANVVAIAPTASCSGVATIIGCGDGMYSSATTASGVTTGPLTCLSCPAGTFYASVAPEIGRAHV
jgi:hypothetical protein